MNELKIQVENIKCGGCMNSIKKAMLSIPGVQAAEVSKENETVTILGYDFNAETVLNRLAELGYPEKGNNSLLSKAKSFISCATGKMN